MGIWVQAEYGTGDTETSQTLSWPPSAATLPVLLPPTPKERLLEAKLAQVLTAQR